MEITGAVKSGYEQLVTFLKGKKLWREALFG